MGLQMITEAGGESHQDTSPPGPRQRAVLMPSGGQPLRPRINLQKRTEQGRIRWAPHRAVLVLIPYTTADKLAQGHNQIPTIGLVIRVDVQAALALVKDREGGKGPAFHASTQEFANELYSTRILNRVLVNANNTTVHKTSC